MDAWRCTLEPFVVTANWMVPFPVPGLPPRITSICGSLLVAAHWPHALFRMTPTDPWPPTVANVGIWLGLKITRKKEVVVLKEVPVPVSSQPFALNEERLRNLGITKRELQILELIAHGLSNREIAEKLFVSENTVKTHSSRLFDKLSAKRRTQAVQIGKEMGLIP